jgi:hypothetical protein
MSFHIVAALICGLMGVGCLVLVVLTDPPRRRRPNRLLRGRLPPPSDRCKRNPPEALAP